MRKLAIAITGLGLSLFAQTANADLYRISDRIGMGASTVFNFSDSENFGYGLHGDYTIGLYSWSHSLYFQTDYSVDIFHTELQATNWSLIVTKDFGSFKLGGFVGAFMQNDTDIHFSGGLTGMAQLGSNTIVQGEIGALTNGEDSGFFINNVYFGHVRVDYAISDEYGVYAKYSRLQDGGGEVDRGIVGITYSEANSPWILNGGVGAFRDEDGYHPLINAEFKYEFGGDALPQQPSKLAGTYFDKFEFFDFNIN